MKNSMIIYLSEYDKGKKTFKLMPITDECPFIHATYLPDEKILSIFSREYKERPIMLPKYNDKGIPVTVNTSNGMKIAEERRMIDMYYEYALTEPEDILEFIYILSTQASNKRYSDFINELISNNSEKSLDS